SKVEIDDLAARLCTHGPPSYHIDVVGDKANRAIAKGGVDPARVFAACGRPPLRVIRPLVGVSKGRGSRRMSGNARGLIFGVIVTRTGRAISAGDDHVGVSRIGGIESRK